MHQTHMLLKYMENLSGTIVCAFYHGAERFLRNWKGFSAEVKTLGKLRVFSREYENFLDVKQILTPDLALCIQNRNFGTQIKNIPETEVSLVADMSSDILSKTIDISKFGLIYAGAQKNIGPAGVTLVIIRSDLLELKYRDIPTMMSYNTHASKESMFNTPPVFSVCVVNETLKWLKQLGGLDSMANLSISS